MSDFTRSLVSLQKDVQDKLTGFLMQDCADPNGDDFSGEFLREFYIPISKIPTGSGLGGISGFVEAVEEMHNFYINDPKEYIILENDLEITPIEHRKCDCPLNIIMSTGCKCGGI